MGNMKLIESDTYVLDNVNPKGHKTGDCVVRALVGTLGISYEDAIRRCAEKAIKYCFGITSKNVYARVLADFGYEKQKQPRKENGGKYLVRELISLVESKHPVFVDMANHCTCIKDGKIHDTWDCGGKSVSNYFIKVR